MEFVNKMKKDGKLIMGIGHRVKSVSNHNGGLGSGLGSASVTAFVYSDGRLISFSCELSVAF